ncbi:hypothetical protein HDU93_000682 [Gonapodya sp. JEL0774]|nr:hypothetical protein HDU93_000682 [Gonapodya sp. JEL0774]
MAQEVNQTNSASTITSAVASSITSSSSAARFTPSVDPALVAGIVVAGSIVGTLILGVLVQRVQKWRRDLSLRPLRAQNPSLYENVVASRLGITDNDFYIPPGVPVTLTEIRAAQKRTDPFLLQTFKTEVFDGNAPTQDAHVEIEVDVKEHFSDVDGQMDQDRPTQSQHRFHLTCIDEWLVNARGECPLCRMDLTRRGSWYKSVGSSDSEEDDVMDDQNDRGGESVDGRRRGRRRRRRSLRAIFAGDGGVRAGRTRSHQASRTSSAAGSRSPSATSSVSAQSSHPSRPLSSIFGGPATGGMGAVVDGVPAAPPSDTLSVSRVPFFLASAGLRPTSWAGSTLSVPESGVDGVGREGSRSRSRSRSPFWDNLRRRQSEIGNQRDLQEMEQGGPSDQGGALGAQSASNIAGSSDRNTQEETISSPMSPSGNDLLPRSEIYDSEASGLALAGEGGVIPGGGQSNIRNSAGAA